jgi:hypothetical protein
MARGKSLVAIWRDSIRDSDLKATTKLVAHTLATFMNGTGFAFPARATLARGASLGSGLRSVDVALTELESTGFLEIDRSPGRRSHRYQAVLAATAQPVRRSEWATAQAARGSDDRKPRRNRSATAHESTSNRVRGAPESAESGESAGRPLGGAGRTLLPLDDCMVCLERQPLYPYRGQLVCQQCITQRTRAPADELREHIAEVRPV